VLHRLGKFEEAKIEYARALALKPDFAAAWSNLGAAFLARSKFSDAEACLLRAKTLDPRNRQVLGNLAECVADPGKIRRGDRNLSPRPQSRPKQRPIDGETGARTGSDSPIAGKRDGAP
jgi:Flp pilus assembly protein TadD